MFDVAVVGSANLDLVAGVDRIPRPGETLLGRSYAEFAGGKGLNQAVAAARAGAQVAFVGAVGGDEAGRRLRAVAEADGIDVDGLAVSTGLPTGRALITVAEGGENSIVVVPGANSTVAGDTVPRAHVVAAQLEVPIAAVTAAFVRAHEQGATTLLNPAPAAPLPDELLAACDVVVPNEHEVDAIGGVDDLRRRGVGTVVVTRGSAGLTVTDDAGTATIPAFAVTPIDTTGAGDAFCGALAARLAAGDEMRTALRWAAAAGALATTTAGAVPSLPHGGAVEELLLSAPG